MNNNNLSNDDILEQIKTKRAHINNINKINYYKRKEENRNKMIIPIEEQKKRGRPRKVINNDLIDPNIKVDLQIIVEPKKTRGRKKKEITTSDIQKLIKIQDTKKPRGRPPKTNIILVNEDDQDIQRLKEKFNIIDSNDDYKIE